MAEFYLGHRRSFYLDLFTSQLGLVLPFSHVAAKQLLWKGRDGVVVRRLASFVEFQISWGQDEVRVQLAYESPYQFASSSETDLGWVRDFGDLVVDKLLAFFGWALPGDGVDLAFIFRGIDPWDVVELSSVKAPGFDL